MRQGDNPTTYAEQEIRGKGWGDIQATTARMSQAGAGAATADQALEGDTMATQQETEAFLRGWRAAMDEVLAVLETEAREWVEEEQEATASGEYKLPGSFALEEVSSSFKGRHDLLAWIAQNGPAAARKDDPALASALEALVENRATDDERALLGLARQSSD